MPLLPKKPVRKKQLVFFKVIAILSPLIVLLVLETGLRLLRYGYNPDLFVDAPNNPGYLVMNEHTSKKYFAQQQNATIGNHEIFKKQKTPGTLRIFVLGESTTIGYPYMHNGSFHRWLQYRLTHSFPDREFEIINLSLTAVNSYTVLDFARQIVHYQPDAVLIYTGHNEYYGALGVGSTSFAGWNPRLIRFIIQSRELRLIQLATNALVKIKNLTSSEKIDLHENLMKRMVSDQKIALNSKPYQQGIEQFEANMTDLCIVLNSSNIPIFISTLVSNEKDLKPFISGSPKVGNSASEQYQLGQKAYSNGNFTKAENHFIQAKELDMLRFRAPAAMNKIIRNLSVKFTNVTIVDSEKLFRQNSIHGILGNETLLEHVHPNLFGYALLSDAFYDALKAKKLVIANSQQELSFVQLRQKMPITPIDSLKAVYEMMMLKEGWPFNEPMPAEAPHKKTIEEHLAGGLAVKQISWETAHGELLKFYLKEKNWKGALRIIEALALEFPQEPAYQAQAGLLNQNLKNTDEALFYLKRAFACQNNFKTAQTLFIILLREDRPDEALPYLNYAAANNPSHFSMTELQNLVRQIVSLKQQYKSDSTNTHYSNQIALNYLRFANARAAKKYITRTLQHHPSNLLALKLRRKANALTEE